MLRRNRGFFGGLPLAVIKNRLWWQFRRFRSRLLWRAHMRFAVWNWAPSGWSVAGVLQTSRAAGNAVWQRLRRLTPHDMLNLALLATAVYFFTGWFAGLRAEPGDTVNRQIVVWRHDTKSAISMPLEEYLKGVVAAEMPVSFHIEALKAQAIAARTYTLHTLATRKGVPGHPEADVTTDPAIDQAWTSESALRRRWGFLEYYWRWRKISRAVDETRGLVLTYGGNLISAVFHSDSGGVTENAENYWSSSVPYLRSVPDPVPANSPYTLTKVTLPYSQIIAAVQKVAESAQQPALPVTAKAQADGKSLVNVLKRYPSGRVELVAVGDKTLSGRALREALGLRSNWFDVSDNGQAVEFTVHGYGHGVGMSQFGADAYAKAGASYADILQYYYTGVQITHEY